GNSDSGLARRCLRSRRSRSLPVWPSSTPPRASPRRIGAADALGLDRGDQAGLERDLPGAANLSPPFLALGAFGFAQIVQRGVLAPQHTGDGEGEILRRL